MTVDMKPVPTSDPIDLTTWFDDTEYDNGLGGLVLRGAVAQISDLLRKVFADSPPRMGLPFEWSSPKQWRLKASDGRKGPAVTDPVMLYVDLPLCETDDAFVSYSLSLEDCIDDVIELQTSWDDDDDKTEGRRICGELAARLRQLADKIDDACKDDAS